MLEENGAVEGESSEFGVSLLCGCLESVCFILLEGGEGELVGPLGSLLCHHYLLVKTRHCCYVDNDSKLSFRYF